MYCTHCGKEIKDNAEYCPYCGSPQKMQKGSGEKESSPVTQKKGRKGAPFIFIILAVVLLVIAAAVLGLIKYNNSPESKIRKQLELGDKYLSEIDYDRAIAAYTDALAIDPKNTDVKVALADAYKSRAEQYIDETSDGSGEPSEQSERAREDLRIAHTYYSQVLEDEAITVEKREEIAERGREINEKREQLPTSPEPDVAEGQQQEKPGDVHNLSNEYLKVIDSLDRDYGELRQSEADGFSEADGVVYINLIDLNKDGSPELFAVCKNETDRQYIGYVYSIVDGKAECVLAWDPNEDTGDGPEYVTSCDQASNETIRLVNAGDLGYLIAVHRKGDAEAVDTYRSFTEDGDSDPADGFYNESEYTVRTPGSDELSLDNLQSLRDETLAWLTDPNTYEMILLLRAAYMEEGDVYDPDVEGNTIYAVIAELNDGKPVQRCTAEIYIPTAFVTQYDGERISRQFFLKRDTGENGFADFRADYVAAPGAKLTVMDKNMEEYTDFEAEAISGGQHITIEDGKLDLPENSKYSIVLKYSDGENRYNDTFTVWVKADAGTEIGHVLYNIEQDKYIEPDMSGIIVSDEEIKEFNGHSYCFLSVPHQSDEPNDDFWQAASVCRELGGHLVTITSREEMEFVGKMYAGDPWHETVGTWYAMIGAYREHPEDPWRWVTGEEFTYTDDIPQDDPANNEQLPETEWIAIQATPYYFAGTEYSGPLGNWHNYLREDPSRYDTIRYFVEWDYVR